jgi:hypothetical protein
LNIFFLKEHTQKKKKKKRGPWSVEIRIPCESNPKKKGEKRSKRTEKMRKKRKNSNFLLKKTQKYSLKHPNDQKNGKKCSRKDSKKKLEIISFF